MTIEQLADRFASYLRKSISNPQQMSTRAFLRALDTDAGKAVLVRRIRPILSMFADEHGNYDLSELKEIAKAAIGEETFSFLDIVSLSSADVDAFFASCQT